MRIEEEIKSGFENVYHKTIVNILYTNNVLIDKMNEQFKTFDITRQQYNVLRILRGQHPNPVPVSLIKERMLDKMSDASRIVDRLLKKALIAKRISKEDRRSADILISESGLNLLDQMDDVMSSFNDRIKVLKESEAEQLNNLLDKLRDHNE